jgi:hypothetical protein
LDVLVIGDHPSAYFAALLLARAKVRVQMAHTPAMKCRDRLVLLNPGFFGLDRAFSGFWG